MRHGIECNGSTPEPQTIHEVVPVIRPIEGSPLTRVRISTGHPHSDEVLGMQGQNGLEFLPYGDAFESESGGQWGRNEVDYPITFGADDEGIVGHGRLNPHDLPCVRSSLELSVHDCINDYYDIEYCASSSAIHDFDSRHRHAVGFPPPGDVWRDQ